MHCLCYSANTLVLTTCGLYARLHYDTNHNQHPLELWLLLYSSVHAVNYEYSPWNHNLVYTHCYSHCLNLSIAASCEVQEVRNLVSTINEAHLFLSSSPKRQRLLELTIKEFLPAYSHSKLPGLCKTWWVERHTCFEVFFELYEPLVIFLDVILSPCEYPQLSCDDGSWNWDTETRAKAQGSKAALSSFQNLAVFFITKNVLDGQNLFRQSCKSVTKTYTRLLEW